jgi:AmmeMemoRadiSam system protein A
MSGGLGAAERRTLLTLARSAIADRLGDDGSLERARGTAEITPALQEVRGAFVTLRGPERVPGGTFVLRGCIGTVFPEEPLHDNVVHNAVHAAFDDPRFPPVEPAELVALTIEISALTPMRSVTDPETIETGRHGVHLEHGAHRAVFLPQVATEQGWTRRDLLEHLALKAGLPRDGWRDAVLQVFEAEVFGERD